MCWWACAGTYLGKNGFRYNLNKTPEELEKEGDYNIFQKMFGATSNNAARLAARAEARKLVIETYSPAKAKENASWLDRCVLSPRGGRRAEAVGVGWRGRRTGRGLPAFERR